MATRRKKTQNEINAKIKLTAETEASKTVQDAISRVMKQYTESSAQMRDDAKKTSSVIKGVAQAYEETRKSEERAAKAASEASKRARTSGQTRASRRDIPTSEGQITGMSAEEAEDALAEVEAKEAAEALKAAQAAKKAKEAKTALVPAIKTVTEESRKSASAISDVSKALDRIDKKAIREILGTTESAKSTTKRTASTPVVRVLKEGMPSSTIGSSTQSPYEWAKAAMEARMAQSKLNSSIQEGQSIIGKYSEEAQSRIAVVKQIMEQLNVEYKEAIELADQMQVGGSKVPPITPAVKQETTKYFEELEALRQAQLNLNNAQQDGGGIMEANAMSTEELNKLLAQTGGNISDAAQKWKSFGAAFAGFQLRFIGQSLSRFSKDMLMPIDTYVNKMGVAERVSAEWADTQKQVEDSTARIGRSLASSLLPAMQAIADVAERIAEMFEKYPMLSKAAVGLTIGSAILGQLLTVSGTLFTAIAALKYIAPALFGLGQSGGFGALISGAIGASAAEIGVGAAVGAEAGAAGAAAVTGASLSAMVSAVVPIVIAVGVGAIAVAAYKALSATEFGKERNLADAPGQAWALIAKNFGNLFGKEFGDRQFMKVAKFMGLLDDVADTAERATGKLGPSAEAIDAYIEYLTQAKELEEQYEQDRLDTVAEYAKQRAKLERDYREDLADIDQEIAEARSSSSKSEIEYRKTITQTTRDYQRDDQADLEDYLRRRAKLSRDYNIDVQRAEEDHQRQMRQMQEDHDDRIQQLLFENDAFGILAEMQSYEKERARQEEEYQVDAARRSEDFALRLRDMEEEFAIERQKRAEDFRIRIQEQIKQRQEERAAEIADLMQRRKELQEQHAKDMKELNQEEQEKLALLERNKNKELQKLTAAFTDNLRAIDASLLKEKNIRIAYYEAMSKDLQSWLNSMEGQFQTNLPNYPARQYGGYASGIVRTGEVGYEYVLSHDTTKYMEAAIGGQLTQERIRQGYGTNRASVTVNQNYRFDSSMSADERRWFRQVARQEAGAGLLDALGA